MKQLKIDPKLEIIRGRPNKRLAKLLGLIILDVPECYACGAVDVSVSTWQLFKNKHKYDLPDIQNGIRGNLIGAVADDIVAHSKKHPAVSLILMKHLTKIKTGQANVDLAKPSLNLISDGSKA